MNEDDEGDLDEYFEEDDDDDDDGAYLFMACLIGRTSAEKHVCLEFW